MAQAPSVPSPAQTFEKIMPEFPLADVAAGVSYYRDVLGFAINYQMEGFAVLDRDRGAREPPLGVARVSRVPARSSVTMDDSTVRRFYEQYDEAARLNTGPFRLERARTEILMEALLPAPPAVVLDVGGGPGVYACALAARGYAVHLVDLVPRLVEQAQARARALGVALASARAGDARTLAFDDACADAVLLFGPLYHLLSRADRLRALREAERVLRPGGVVMAAGISRYASLIDGFLFGALDDPRFAEIVFTDLETGCHRNPTDKIDWFTDAYFHAPSELADEMTEAGFADVEIRAIEGIGWLLPDFAARWSDEPRRAQLLDWIARTDRAPSLLGVSAHLMGVGTRNPLSNQGV